MSISAEPSIAQTSELAVDNVVAPAVADVGDSVQGKFDTVTALEVASRTLPVETVVPVWEQGIWGVIFGNKSLLDVYKPFGESLKRPIDTSLSCQPDSGSGGRSSSSRPRTQHDPSLSFSDVVRDKPDIPWQEQRDADLQSSVKFWMALVERWNPDCSVARSLDSLKSRDRVFTMFAHLFAGRSPVTIRKRGYNVMRLCDYLDTRGCTFPCDESTYYDFLCSELTSGAPQS